MNAVFLSVAAALLLAGGILAQTPLVINTPTAPVICQPLLITWSGGTPPYFLSILPGNQPGGPALLNFGQVIGTDLTWVVNITSGTSLGLTLRDSTGIIAQSASFIVQPGKIGDTSCLHPSSTTTSHTGHTTTSTKPHTTTSGSTSRGAHTSSSASHRTSTTSHASASTPRPPSLTLSQTGTVVHPVTSTPTTGFSGSPDTTTDPSTTPTTPTISGTSPAASTTPSTSSAAGVLANGGISRSLGFVFAAITALIL